MNGTTLIEVGCVAAIVIEAVILYLTGAWWTVVPVGIGLYVAKLVKDAMEKDSSAPTDTPKRGKK